MAMRLSVSSATGLSPHFILFGREARLPVELIYPPPPEDELYIGPFLQKQVQTYRNIFQHVLNKFGQNNERTGSNYDPRANPFKEKSLVWLLC